MIGRIFNDTDEATLGDDGMWTSDDELLAPHLNRFYNLKDYSPADGWPGHRQIALAAAQFGFQAEIAKVPEAPYDRVLDREGSVK
jgi:hypothetical protein